MKAALDALVGAHRAKFEPLSEHRAVKNFQTLDPGGGGGGNTRGQKAGAHRGRNSEFEHPHRRHRPCGRRRWTTALQFALPDFMNLVHSDDREFLRETMRPYGEGEESDMVGATDIFRIVTPDGDPRQFALGFGMSYSTADNSAVLAGLLRDVTASRRMRKDLTRARDQAEKANAAKSRFLATMSHELRTPINGILGMNDLLLDSQLSPDQRDYAETVRVSGEALLGIITDILDFSKIEAGRLELDELDFSLADLIGSVVRLLDPRALEKDLNISWRGWRPRFRRCCVATPDGCAKCW